MIPIDGGPPVKNLKVSQNNKIWRWSPDGKSLQYVFIKDGVENIWEQSLAGGPPKQLTKFTSGKIFDFNWSSDHTKLLLARGEITSDVVLLRNHP